MINAIKLNNLEQNVSLLIELGSMARQIKENCIHSIGSLITACRIENLGVVLILIIYLLQNRLNIGFQRVRIILEF